MMSVAILFCVLAVLFPENVMQLYTDKESIRQVGVEYLKIVGFSYPLMVFSMAMATPSAVSTTRCSITSVVVSITSV
jgi:Na+-driven multidrug efflux pump